ncbi:MAG: hypothetical protein H6702_08900 [Myxococcales bacterium]|nr:hypothetical protein [Myxococcales bacterium]
MPLLHRALTAYARLDRAVDRAQAAAQGILGGALLEALHDAEQAALTARLYGVGGPGPTGLFAWEQTWFQDLPAGRILVGGAGRGREVQALRGLGHPVDALDPAPGVVDALLAAGAERAVAADYADLVSAVLDGAATPASPLTGPYAAVLLGWGSLTHVLGGDARLRLVQACHRLCPRGPILASFWLAGSAQAQAPSRAETVGRRLGRTVGRLRGRAALAEARQFTRWAGVGAVLTGAEVEALGRGVGRDTRWGPEGPYPHVTWPAPQSRAG